MTINQFGCRSKRYKAAIASAAATETEYRDRDDGKMCTRTGNGANGGAYSVMNSNTNTTGCSVRFVFRVCLLQNHVNQPNNIKYTDDLAEFVTILHASILNTDTIARIANLIFFGCLHSNLRYSVSNPNKMST